MNYTSTLNSNVFLYGFKTTILTKLLEKDYTKGRSSISFEKITIDKLNIIPHEIRFVSFVYDLNMLLSISGISMVIDTCTARMTDFIT